LCATALSRIFQLYLDVSFVGGGIGFPRENHRPVANHRGLQLKEPFDLNKERFLQAKTYRNTHTDIHGKKVQI
jgi:hypothetical protein